MKKLLIHFSLIIVFIVIYLLQVLFFSNFTISGIMPNIFIIFILFIGLYMGRCFGIIYGIIFGILIDIWIGKNIGITSVAMAIIGLLGGTFDKNFSKDSRITIIFMGAICTIIYEILLYIIHYVIFDINIEILNFIKILSIEIVYNSILISLFHPIMKSVGYEIEDVIKGDKILTRYF